MRLIDILREEIPLMSDVKVIIGDEVLKGIDEGPDRTWDIEDFFCVAPPFDIFFIEAKSTVVTDAWMGTLFIVFDIQNETDSLIVDKLRELFPGYIHPDSRWIFGIVTIGCLKKKLQVREHQMFLCVNEAGKLLNRLNDVLAVPAANMLFSKIVNRKVQLNLIRTTQGLIDFLPFSLQTLSLLHVKNVVLAETTPPEKLSRARMKKRGLPLSKFYTLKIDVSRVSSKKVGETVGFVDLKAAHVVRGHYKDYREKGLFGKYKGVYWVPAYAAGSKEAGQIEKQYEVKR